MNEQNKKQIIIAAVLGAVLIGVLVYQFLIVGGPKTTSGTQPPGDAAANRRADRERTAQEASSAVLKKVDIDIDALISSVEVTPINYAQVRIARNPMTPLVGVALPQRMGEGGEGEQEVEAVAAIEIDAMASKHISGIIWSERHPVAIVDDELVYVGYVFPNGAQVRAIEPTRVLIQVGDAVVPVEMKEF